ncbi:hypothetical protein BpHYR1_042684 [Brachionus plicatilis]|uniref:Uncharacterized protein n=1 Tax=Brachionus plicatilis TaxID=10195 RepID=A0A3M7QPD5_BRAPC|nr:hypothetical protein BpHYR1_042684 [Brachionus plicatilis]
MKIKLIILMLAQLLLICGTESTILNQTDDLVVLTKVGSPYKIHQDLVVDENQTLIIEPGVTLLFAPTKQFMVKEDHIGIPRKSFNKPFDKLLYFSELKCHKVCFRRNEDKINQDYFVKSICSNFGYRKGWIKKSFNSAGFRIALISSCSENHIQSFDLNKFKWFIYLGGLVIDEKTSLSFVDINEAGGEPRSSKAAGMK